MTKYIPPLFGGWTPTYHGDPCQGGHPPQSISRGLCGRCGRLIDQSRCLCGEESHRSGLSRSMCPTRMRFDKRDAETHLSVPYFLDELTAKLGRTLEIEDET